MHEPRQHCVESVQRPPSDTHCGPPDWQMPYSHTLPEQQSAVVVHVPEPAARQPDAQANPVALTAFGTHT